MPSIAELLESARNPPPLPEQEAPPEGRIASLLASARDGRSAFLDDSARKQRDWSEVEPTLTGRFGEVSPQAKQEYQLASARHRYAAGEEDTLKYVARRSIPGFSAGFNLGEGQRYQKAKERFNKGEATETDVNDIAAYERMQQARSQESFGQSALGVAASLPAMLGEAVVGGRAVSAGAKALGFGKAAATAGAATQAPSRIGAALRATPMEVAKTPLMPSMYLAQAQERANQQGGEWSDLKNIGPAGAYAVLQVGILGHMGRVGNAAGKSMLRRGAEKSGFALAEQQAGDAAMTGASELLKRSGFEEFSQKGGYGAVGKMMDGEWGEAGKELALQAMTMSAFAGLSAKGGGRTAASAPAPEIVKALAEDIQDQQRQGKSKAAITAELNEVGKRFEALLQQDPATAWETAREMYLEEQGKAGTRYTQALTKAVLGAKVAEARDAGKVDWNPLWDWQDPEVLDFVKWQGFDAGDNVTKARKWVHDNYTPEKLRAMEAQAAGETPPETPKPPEPAPVVPKPPEPATDDVYGQVKDRFPDVPEAEARAALSADTAAANEGFQKWSAESERLLKEGRPVSDRDLQKAQQLASLYLWSAQRPANETPPVAPKSPRSADPPPGDSAPVQVDDRAPERATAPQEAKVGAKAKKKATVEELKTRFDDLAQRRTAGEEVDPAEGIEILRELEELGGLTDKQKDILTRRTALSETQQAIGDEAGVTREAVRQQEKAGLEKLGALTGNKVGSIEEAVSKPTRLDRVLDDAESGREVSFTDLHADPEAPVKFKGRKDAVDQKWDDLGKITDELERLSDAGELTPERLAELSAAADRIHKVTPIGSKGKKRPAPEAARQTAEARKEGVAKPSEKKGGPEGFGRPVTDEERAGVGVGGGQENATGASRPIRETALANAKVDEDRKNAGLPPIMSAARLENATVWDEAMATLDRDPDASARLVTELLQKSRATTVQENALLLHRRVSLANEQERATLQYVRKMREYRGTAGAVKKPTDAQNLELNQLEARADELLAQVNEVDQVSRSTGTEWGRAGQFRRQMAREDFSLSSMLLRAEAAKRAPLTPEEKVEITKQHEEIRQADEALEKAEEAEEVVKAEETLVKAEEKLAKAKAKEVEEVAKAEEATEPAEKKSAKEKAAKAKKEADGAKEEVAKAKKDVAEKKKRPGKPAAKEGEEGDKTDLRIRTRKTRQKATETVAKLKHSSLPTHRRILGNVGEGFNLLRGLITGQDLGLSAVARQGGFGLFSHPIRTLKAIPDAWRAAWSERRFDRQLDAINQRPNAELYKQSGLHIADVDGPLAAQEEAVMSRLARRIPGLAQSQRGYTAILNRLRADSFDALEASLARNGKATPDEAKALANFVNVATGRGKLGKIGKTNLESAAVPLAQLFFSPRYVVSRFQLLAGQPLYWGSWRTRKLVAQEYGRALIGLGTFYGLASILNEDESIEADPRSSDFGKIRFGSTRVDPLAGLAQPIVLGAKIVTGEKRKLEEPWQKPSTVDIRGDKKPVVEDGVFGEMMRFGRTKLAPVPGAAVNIASGEDVIGRSLRRKVELPGGAEVGKGRGAMAVRVAADMTVPMYMRDVLDVMQEQGATRGFAVNVLNFFGMGVQKHEQNR